MGIPRPCIQSTPSTEANEASISSSTHPQYHVWPLVTNIPHCYECPLSASESLPEELPESESAMAIKLKFFS